MGNKLKPKDVNDALEDIDVGGMKSDITDMKSDITDMKSDITDIKSDITDIESQVISIYTWEAETKPVIATGETVDITTDIYNIIASGKYLLQITLTVSISNTTASRTNVICTLSQYGCILDRSNMKMGMFRLSLDSDNTKILFTTYGDTTFYLGTLKLFKL